MSPVQIACPLCKSISNFGQPDWAEKADTNEPAEMLQMWKANSSIHGSLSKLRSSVLQTVQRRKRVRGTSESSQAQTRERCVTISTTLVRNNLQFKYFDLGEFNPIVFCLAH